MSDDMDWTITLTFSVPVGDTEGVMTEAIFDAAVEHAPSGAEGLVARADTREGKVWITFTLPEVSREFAHEVAGQMRARISAAVVTGEDPCVIAV